MEKKDLQELIEITKEELKEDLSLAITNMSQDYTKKHKALTTIEELEKQLDKAGKTTIEVNNGCKLKVELKDNRLIFTKLDAKGNIERADAVLDGEIVLLYDYILDRRDKGLELF